MRSGCSHGFWVSHYTSLSHLLVFLSIVLGNTRVNYIYFYTTNAGYKWLLAQKYSPFSNVSPSLGSACGFLAIMIYPFRQCSVIEVFWHLLSVGAASRNLNLSFIVCMIVLSLGISCLLRVSRNILRIKSHLQRCLHMGLEDPNPHLFIIGFW